MLNGAIILKRNVSIWLKQISLKWNATKPFTQFRLNLRYGVFVEWNGVVEVSILNQIGKSYITQKRTWRTICWFRFDKNRLRWNYTSITYIHRWILNWILMFHFAWTNFRCTGVVSEHYLPLNEKLNMYGQAIWRWVCDG